MNRPVNRHTALRLLRAAVSLALLSRPLVAAAQGKGIDVTPTVGYRFDGTLSTETGTLIGSVDVPGSVSFGLTVELPIHPSWNVEVLWSHQESVMRADFYDDPPPGIDPEFSDLAVDAIQAGALWQSGRKGDRVRGYLDFLLGATLLHPSNEFSALTRFSTALGGGGKFMLSEHVGLRAGFRWTLAWLGAKNAGYAWCSPSWGCYEYYDTNYLSQVDTHLGLVVRF